MADDTEYFPGTEGTHFAGKQLPVSDLGLTRKEANLRLDLTRQALRSLIDNEFAYLQLIAAIEAAADEGRETLE